MAFSRIKNGWRSAQVAAGVILTVYGLVQLLRDAFAFTKSPLLTAIVGLLIGGVCGLPFLYHLLAPASLREFGLGRLKADRVCVKYEKTVFVDADLRARVTTRRTWVFLETPADDDLFDSYSIDPKLLLEEFRYSSPDATETGRGRGANNKVTVFWRPRTPIAKFLLYTHEDSWQPPMKYDSPSCMTMFHSIEKTGEFTTIVKVPFQIEHASVFRRPRLRALRSDRSHMKYALKHRESRWGTAEISEDGHTLTWRLHEPQPGRVYECVFFKTGGVHYWQEEISERAISRVFAAIRRKLGRIR